MTNPQPIWKSPGGKGFAVIPLIIILAVLAVGGYWYWQKADKAVEVPSDWRTYRNEKYGFEVKYPPGYTFTLSSPVASSARLNDGHGNSIIANEIYLRNTNYDYEDSLGKAIEANAGDEYLGVSNKNRLEFRRLLTDKNTLGYFSRWEINVAGEIIYQTRADFESLTEKLLKTETGKYKSVVALVARPEFNDLELFNQILSTFKFVK